MAFGLFAASSCFWTARRPALFRLLRTGDAGFHLFAQDALDDVQHGVWGQGANGMAEPVMTVVTLTFSLFVPQWTRARRDALLS